MSRFSRWIALLAPVALGCIKGATDVPAPLESHHMDPTQPPARCAATWEVDPTPARDLVDVSQARYVPEPSTAPPTPAMLEEARARLAHGAALLRDADAESAATELTRVYLLSGSVELLPRIALAHEKAGHHAQAYAFYEGYLRVADPPAERVRGVRAALSQLAGRAAYLRVSTDLRATLMVDRFPVAMGPFRGQLMVDAGPRALTAALEGCELYLITQTFVLVPSDPRAFILRGTFPSP